MRDSILQIIIFFSSTTFKLIHFMALKVNYGNTSLTAESMYPRTFSAWDFDIVAPILVFSSTGSPIFKLRVASTNLSVNSLAMERCTKTRAALEQTCFPFSKRYVRYIKNAAKIFRDFWLT